MIPPRHVEFPLVAMELWVEKASVLVLPKKACRCEERSLPGNTIGSSKFMCENRHEVRNAPVPSPLTAGNSVVGRTKVEEVPGDPVGIADSSTYGMFTIGMGIGSGVPAGLAASYSQRYH